jgi:hypothetical protein
MPVTLKLVTGEELVVKGDVAVVMPPFMVIHAWTHGKLVSGETFPLDGIAWARNANGNIVVGGGKVQGSGR